MNDQIYKLWPNGKLKLINRTGENFCQYKLFQSQ